MDQEKSMKPNKNNLHDFIGKTYNGRILLEVLDEYITYPSRPNYRIQMVRWRCAHCGHEYTGGCNQFFQKESKRCKNCPKPAPSLPPIDYTGRQYGVFRVMGLAEPYHGIATRWICKCTLCGAEVTRMQRQLGDHNTCICQRKRICEDELPKFMEVSSAARVDGTFIYAISSHKVNKNSSTGVRGVSRMKNGSYRAYINLRRKQYHIGTFPTLEEATEARKNAEKKMYDDIIREWEEKNK